MWDTCHCHGVPNWDRQEPGEKMKAKWEERVQSRNREKGMSRQKERWDGVPQEVDRKSKTRRVEHEREDEAKEKHELVGLLFVLTEMKGVFVQVKGRAYWLGRESDRKGKVITVAAQRCSNGICVSWGGAELCGKGNREGHEWDHKTWYLARQILPIFLETLKIQEVVMISSWNVPHMLMLCFPAGGTMLGGCGVSRRWGPCRSR